MMSLPARLLDGWIREISTFVRGGDGDGLGGQSWRPFEVGDE
jgi:hypothetical protein